MIYRTKARHVFELCNYLLFGCIALTILLPFANVIAISFSDYQYIVRGEVTLWPIGFNLDSYKAIVTNIHFVQCLRNSVVLAVLNTLLCIFIALMAGYALASKHFVGKPLFFGLILIPMYFSGGLIPTYIMMDRYGLIDNFLVLVFPLVTNSFYVIVFLNHIKSLPGELLDSAEMDGAGDFTTMLRIVMPIVMPMVAAFMIFAAVAYWNEWFNVLIYIRSKDKWTLQFKLRELIMISELSDSENQFKVIDSQKINPANLKMAAVMVSILPILAVYPFMQRYFIHGVIVGAVKG